MIQLLALDHLVLTVAGYLRGPDGNLLELTVAAEGWSTPKKYGQSNARKNIWPTIRTGMRIGVLKKGRCTLIIKP